MAAQAQFQNYGQNKGTLTPGQSITVNKHEVQVERYLSQGGFAHVYLVRTVQPVYGTTRHVLKRIAVANDAMLAEVKKEVDIMRILKGHPNIVFLIDAAWHKMANGIYEVFILMEFCQGGGIIDMMNRRLRERLTEAEILQIFVDVCEGVAAMHNLRPALLHRDLKVENILQASATSFKLCDFGSATPVPPRVPSSNAEIRALEADLNRHTTLQYRAPEMVDPYLRRPIDEKSDVWALGVLLYKLCYYTTPFEEHGPLAILNVQYRTPPYPVYSQQINALIASMLREHGVHRPSVFEVLNSVHSLRGTKSQFKYDLPETQPLSPRKATLTSSPAANPLDNLVSFRSSQPSTSPGKNAGVEAREKVLEAIAPMRRGRPANTSVDLSAHLRSRPGSRQTSPSKITKADTSQVDLDFDNKWQKMQSSQPAVRGHKSGIVGSSDAWQVRSTASPGRNRSPWEPTAAGTSKPSETSASGGFENDFAEKLWESYDTRVQPNSTLSVSSTPHLAKPSKRSPIPPTVTPSGSQASVSSSKSKDAFEGLGLSPSSRDKAPTLAEAHRLRADAQYGSRPSSSQTSLSARPSPIPPTISPAWTSPPLPSSSDETPENRFPSLEELDATFASPSSQHAPIPHSITQPPTVAGRYGDMTGHNKLRPPMPQQSSNMHSDGVRSEHVTGAAMRSSLQKTEQKAIELPPKPSYAHKGRSGSPDSSVSRPTLSRKHRSSISISHGMDHGSQSASATPSDSSVIPPTLPPRPSTKPDWLTGDHLDNVKPLNTPVLRSSPGKRNSYMESGGMTDAPLVAEPQSAVVERELVSLYAEDKPPQKSRSHTNHKPQTIDIPSNDTGGPHPTESWSPGPVSSATNKFSDSPSSDDMAEGPEDPHGSIPALRDQGTRRNARQSSVYQLVDLWSTPTGAKEPESRPEPITSPARDRRMSQGVRSTSPVKRDTRSAVAAGNGDISRRSTLHVRSATSTASASPQKALSRSGTRPVDSFSQPKGSEGPKGNRLSVVAPSAVRPSAAAKSPRSAKTQSMFAFPVAKSPSEGGPPKSTEPLSPGLAPPPDSRPRSGRRSSISDMVQRYEALEKTIVPNVVSPAIALKPTALRTDTNKAPGVQQQARANIGADSLQRNSLQVFNPSERDQPPTGGLSARASTNTHYSAKPESNVRLPGLATRSSYEPPKPNLTGRRSPGSRTDSTSTASYDSSRQSEGGGIRLPGLASKSSYDQRKSNPAGTSADVPFPSRKFTTTHAVDSDTATSPESEQSSYQGVGKLIDQWQKKAQTTAPASEVGRRSGFVASRTGNR